MKKWGNFLMWKPCPKSVHKCGEQASKDRQTGCSSAQLRAASICDICPLVGLAEARAQVWPPGLPTCAAVRSREEQAFAARDGGPRGHT